MTSLVHYAQEQTKIDKKIEKIEELMEFGDFSKAQKENDKLQKKLEQSSSNSRNKHFAFSLLREAQIEAATGGEHQLFSQKIDTALIVLQKENDNYYLQGIIKAVQIDFRSNHFKNAGILLDTAQVILGKKANTVIQSRIDFLRTKYLLYIGEYPKAFELSKKNYNYFSKQVADKAKILQTNTLNMQAQILFEQGKYFEADSVLDISKPLIIRHAGEKSPEFVDYLFLKGMVADVLSMNEESYTFLEEAYKKIDNYLMGYTNTVYTSDDLFEYLSVTHWSMGNAGLAEKTQKKYEASIKKHYKSYDFTYNEMLLLEVKKSIIYGDFTESKNLIELWFINPLENIKINPKLSSKVYELKYFSHLALSELDLAEQCLDTLIKIDTGLYPENCPALQTLQMKKGIFYVEYKQELTQASAIYQNHYFKQLEHQLANSNIENIYYKNVLVSILEQKDALTHAEEVMKRVVETVDSYYGEKYLITPEQHVNYAKLLIKTGKYPLAKEHLDLAMRLYTENFGESPEYATALRYMARYFITIHDYESAKIALEKAQNIFKALNYYDYEGADISEFAILYIKQGEYHKVEEVISLSIDNIYAKYDSTSSKLIPEYNKLSELYLAIGLFLEAEEVNQIAVNLSEIHYGKNSLAYGESVFLRGKIYAAIGNNKQSINYFKKAITVLEKVLGNEHLAVAYAYQEIALTYLHHDKNGLKTDARQLLDKAKSIIDKNLGNQNIAYATALKNSSKYHLIFNEYDQALSTLQESVLIWEQLEKDFKNPEGTAEIYLLMAKVLEHQGNTKDAINYYSKSITSYEKIFDDKHPKFLHAKSQMGKLFYALKEDVKALELLNQTTSAYLEYIEGYFPGLSEREKMQFWQMIKTDFEFYYCVAVKNRKHRPEALNKAFNFRLITKSLLLNSSLKMRKQILASDNELLVDLYKEWTEKKDLLDKKRHISSGHKQEIKISEEDLIEEINLLEKELNKETLFKENNKHEKITFKDVKNSLKENQYAVEIIRYRYYDQNFTDSVVYVALILDGNSKKGAVKSIILGNGNDMENKYFKFYTNCFKHELKDTLSYGVYWEQIHKYIGDNKEVFVSLDGIYNQINIDALEIGNNVYVLDKSQVVIISNSADIIELQKKNNTVNTKVKNATLIGNPNFYATGPKVSRPSVSQLTGTQLEIDSIGVLLKSKGYNISTLTQDFATEESFKQLNQTSILHVSTHGFFIPNEDDETLIDMNDTYHTFTRSGLVLTDGGYVIDDVITNNGKSENGILTAYEVMNLSLENTELVVLSACETGVGNVHLGEGVYGLQRAFLVAGAESVIMSLAKVPDEATAKLMSKFYKYWLTSGNKRTAFKKAKQEVRKEHPHPYYWGAFVLIEN